MAWREIELARIARSEIELAGGVILESRILARRLEPAHAVVVAAVSAGAEVDRRSEDLWASDRPDDAYFLDRLAAAVTESLAATVAAELRDALAQRGLGLVPSYSPGYDSWSLGQQARVAGCLADPAPPAWLEVLPSGMLRPKSSLLAVFGITRDLPASEAAWRRDKCSWCGCPECDFRRSSPPPVR